jgi:hypothetical protein
MRLHTSRFQSGCSDLIIGFHCRGGAVRGAGPTWDFLAGQDLSRRGHPRSRRSGRRMVQTPFSLCGCNPDVLSCIANLSNDEVFTRLDFANRMLDILPQALAWDNGVANLWPNRDTLDSSFKCNTQRP